MNFNFFGVLIVVMVVKLPFKFFISIIFPWHILCFYYNTVYGSIKTLITYTFIFEAKELFTVVTIFVRISKCIRNTLE